MNSENNQNPNQRHHHHHHHHKKDDSDRFREHQLRSIKRKKTISRVLFTVTCIVAVAILIAVFWLYTN